MNLCLAQDIKELNFILGNKNLAKEISVIPLNLETQLYCIKNKINYINLIQYIDANFHNSILMASKQLVDELNYGEIKSLSQKKVYRNYIRKRFFSAVFLKKILKEISEKYKIYAIYVSGWNLDFKGNIVKEYFISDLVLTLFKKNKVIALSKNQDIEKKKNIEVNKYQIEDIDKKYKKSILFTSVGYNFSRLFFYSIISGYKVFIPDLQSINWYKKFFGSLLGIKFLKFKKEKQDKIVDLKIKDIDFKFEEEDYSNYLNKSKNVFLDYLIDLKGVCDSIDKFLINNKFSLVISCITRGPAGHFVESAKDNKIPTVNISHGTISKSFTKYDHIYKKIIAEGVFEGNFDFIAIQSKIFEESLSSHEISGKKINTGNLLFAENKMNNEKKNKILYAVTSKNFYGLQFLGVELDCEFIENLKILTKITQTSKFKFLVHLHPSISAQSIDLLKDIFSDLEFSKGNILKSLKKCFATISYSSTVIEDSIFCNVPVILFDQWKRYKHCDSETDFNKINQPIYYTTDQNSLIETINTIKKSKNILFSNITFGGNSKANFYNLLNYLK